MMSRRVVATRPLTCLEGCPSGREGGDPEQDRGLRVEDPRATFPCASAERAASELDRPRRHRITPLRGFPTGPQAPSDPRFLPMTYSTRSATLSRRSSSLSRSGGVTLFFRSGRSHGRPACHQPLVPTKVLAIRCRVRVSHQQSDNAGCRGCVAIVSHQRSENDRRPALLQHWSE
jgi:hypothetical protein